MRNFFFKGLSTLLCIKDQIFDEFRAQIGSMTWRMLTLRASVLYGLLAKTCDLRKPHKKKASGVKSHDLGAQFTSPPREMTMSGNGSCRTSIVACAVWHVAPSC